MKRVAQKVPARGNAVPEDGFALADFKNGIYQGELSFRQKNGIGAYYWDSGEFYFGFWSKDNMHGKGIALIPGEVVVRGTFRNNKLHGKAFVMVGGQVMFICEMHNGKIVGDALRVQLDQDSGNYYAINMRTEQLESNRHFTLGNFEMREEYFMNYDFLRKYGDRVDQYGRTFRMLDFEDGGMYFGVVENDLPSGLGAFVYSDLKFHCGIYSDGLMNGLSRIHFGNGDVYDGEAEDGQMHGSGYFFDCENNDWVFGEFEGDNCTQVLESGEGFPRDNILKFRASLHSSFPQGGLTFNRVTEGLVLDLDILFEYAGKEIKLGLQEQARHSTNQSHESQNKTENSQISQKNGNRRKEMDEFYKKTLASREMSKQSSKQQPQSNFFSNGQTHSRGDSGPHSNMDSVNAVSTEALPTMTHPQPQPKPKPLTQNAGAFQSHNSINNTNSNTNLNSNRVSNSQQSKKSNPGNQIVKDVHVVKPKAFQAYSSVGTGARSVPPSKDLSQQLSPNRELGHGQFGGSPAQSPSHPSSSQKEDQMANLRDMSIQTEDPLPAASNPSFPLTQLYQLVPSLHTPAPADDQTQLSYLKNIQHMVDELKQLVSEKMNSLSVSGGVSPFATVLSGVHNKTQSMGVQVDPPSETRELLEKLEVLRGNLGLREEEEQREREGLLSGKFGSGPHSGNVLSHFETLGRPTNLEEKGSAGFGSLQKAPEATSLDWQGDVEAQLIDLRARQLEEAMAQRFGAVSVSGEPVDALGLGDEDLMEVDENNIGEELEPIKESIDEDDEGETLKPQVNHESTPFDMKTGSKELPRAPRSAVRDNKSETSHVLSPFTDEKIKELQDDSPWDNRNAGSLEKPNSSQTNKLLIQPLQNLVIESRVSNFMDSKRGLDSLGGSLVPQDQGSANPAMQKPESTHYVAEPLEHHVARKYSAPKANTGDRSSERERSVSSKRSSRNASSERSTSMRVPLWYFLNPYMYEVSEEVDFSDGTAQHPVSRQRHEGVLEGQGSSGRRGTQDSSPNPRSLKIEEITLSLVSPGSEPGKALQRGPKAPEVRQFVAEGTSGQWSGGRVGGQVSKPPLNPVAVSDSSRPGKQGLVTGGSRLVLPSQQSLPSGSLFYTPYPQHPASAHTQ